MAIDVWLQALAQSHFLKERGCFPPRVKDPTDIAHFFFQACAIEMTAPQLAVVAATLAGIGKCPTTNKECFSTDVSRTLLSLLYSCGMTSVSVWRSATISVRSLALHGKTTLLWLVSQHAGVWNFHIGVPATCGSSGITMVLGTNTDYPAAVLQAQALSPL